MENITENTEQVQSLTDIQLAALKTAEDALIAYKTEMETKKYLVEISAADLNRIILYMKTEAPWKFTESLGIKEVLAELKSCKIKGSLYMTAVGLEALYFYLSKIEGKGVNVATPAFSSIESYIDMIKKINTVRNIISHENSKLQEYEFNVASLKEGITPVDAEPVI